MSNTDQAGPSNFSFRCQNAFLTYPHCNLHPETVGLMLWSLLEPYGVTYVHVSREHHKDGTPHLHALTQARRRIRTTDYRFFDMEGFHPNIQAVRNPTAVLSYVSKHPSGEFVQGVFRARGARSSTSRAHGARDHHDGTTGSSGNGDRDRHPFATKQSRFNRDSTMTNIMAHANSRSSFLQQVKKAFPYEYCVRMSNWEYAASKLYPEHVEPYNSPFPNEAFHCHESLTEWTRDNIYQVTPQVRPQSLYICGPTRTGKTSWARSLGRHNYWQHNMDFSKYDAEAQYNIIDDIPFKYCPCWKALIGAQREYTVNPKYGKKKVIPGGIPTIVLVNDDEDWMRAMNTQQASYFEANCKTHYMYPGDTFIKEAQASVPEADM